MLSCEVWSYNVSGNVDFLFAGFVVNAGHVPHFGNTFLKLCAISLACGSSGPTVIMALMHTQCIYICYSCVLVPLKGGLPIPFEEFWGPCVVNTLSMCGTTALAGTGATHKLNFWVSQVLGYDDQDSPVGNRTPKAHVYALPQDLADSGVQLRGSFPSTFVVA